MIPDFPQIFKRIPCHSLACTEKEELATSRALATPPCSEAAARLRFDVADLLWTGEDYCFSTQISPWGNELSWQLTTDNRHLPKGLRPTVGTTLQWEASMYIPGWKWGTWCLMNVSILLRHSHGLEDLSWNLRVWKCFEVRAQPVSWQNRNQLWNPETYPNFPDFYVDIEISLMCDFSIESAWGIGLCLVLLSLLCHPPHAHPLHFQLHGNKSLWCYCSSLPGSVSKTFAKMWSVENKQCNGFSYF